MEIGAYTGNRYRQQREKIPGVFCSVGCFLATNEPSALGRATQALQRLQQSTLSISIKAGQPQQPPECMSQSVVQTMQSVRQQVLTCT